MKVLKSFCVSLACLSLASLVFSDASPNYIEAYNGTGNNHNSTVYTLDYSGNQFNSGNSVVGGTFTFGTFENNASQAITGISATTTILPTDSFNVLTSTGVSVLMTSKPTISTATIVGGSTAWADGTKLILTTTGTATITLQDNGTLSGSQLHLASSTRVIGADKIITLIYVAAQNFWDELSYANNN